MANTDSWWIYEEKTWSNLTRELPEVLKSFSVADRHRRDRNDCRDPWPIFEKRSWPWRDRDQNLVTTSHDKFWMSPYNGYFSNLIQELNQLQQIFLWNFFRGCLNSTISLKIRYILLYMIANSFLFFFSTWLIAIML